MASCWSRLPLPGPHVVGVLVGLALDRLTSARLPGWTRSLGPPLVVAGALVNVAAVRVRGADPLDRPSTLVRSGVYAGTRNPMYLGWSGLHLGTALLLRSPGAAATWPVAVLLVHREIRREERGLADGFGEAWTTYAGAVPRYLDASSVSTFSRSVRARARRRQPLSGTTHRA